MEAVITVVGNDTVGILAQVCTALRRGQRKRGGSDPAHPARHLRHDHAGGRVQLLDGFYGLCREDEAAKGDELGVDVALHPPGNL